MRSIILTVVVLGLLVGGFVLFMSFQKAPEAYGGNQPDRRGTPSTTPSSRPALVASSTTQTSTLGAGEEAWVQVFDKETGELASEFKAARYDPPQDGIVHVTEPRARFFTRDKKVLQISARSGEVVIPEQTRKSERMNSIQSGPPSRGTLNDVTIDVLAIDKQGMETSSLTCTVPIVAFDNDAMRLYTVQTEIEGRVVPAERVPIKVRGEYEFDGQGLSMRWNQRDQRLEHLQIEHGGRLRLNNPDSFGASSASAVELVDEGALPIQLVQADERQARKMSVEEAERRRRKQLEAARKAAEAAATQAARETFAYTATFSDDVKINEADRQIGAADRMIAVFTFEESDPAPATQPNAARVDKPKPTTQATTRPTTRRANAPQKVHQPPVEITWTGPLTVVPKKFAESGLRAHNDRSVQLEGSPVTLERDGSQIEAATIAVASVGERFSAKGSDRLGPVVLKDPEGTTLVAPAIDIVGDVAIVTGKSTAELMIADEKGDRQKLLASWSDSGRIKFRNDASGRSIETAEFSGNIDVAHPQLALTSKTLNLVFGNSLKASEPSLRMIEATDSVNATITSSGEKQSIKAHKLRMTASPDATGKLSFNSFSAAGVVTLSNPKQSLTADKVDATFAATDQAKVRVKDLVAEGKVKFKGEDASHASADVLAISTVDGVERITLRGKEVTVADSKTTIVGSLIKISADGSGASVVGAGTLSGLARAADEKSPQPITLSWSESFTYEGAKNKSVVAGDVKLFSDAEDGSLQQATAKRMTITFADAAATASGGIGKKQVDSIELSGGVEVSSVLNDDKEPAQLLRRVHLFAPAMTVKTGKDGAMGPVNIPSAGRMLYDDRRAPAGSAQPGESAIRGTIAIEWNKSMTYDPAAGAVVLDGDVVVVHQQPGEDPVRMLTHKLIAELDDKAATENQQLKRVRTEGGTSFISPKVRFDAAEAVYEPGTDRLVVRGTERQPVEMFDESGLSSGTYEEIWYSLRDNRPERLKNVTGTIRR